MQVITSAKPIMAYRYLRTHNNRTLVLRVTVTTYYHQASQKVSARTGTICHAIYARRCEVHGE
jgi:hypothetical protein